MKSVTGGTGSSERAFSNPGCVPCPRTAALRTPVPAGLTQAAGPDALVPSISSRRLEDSGRAESPLPPCAAEESSWRAGDSPELLEETKGTSSQKYHGAH
ncbi:unnamed protein product [Pleuronectes platessa]|uniref:Uncharacterized protein n=1 Tax=Pleuronectes platessa TaxID=8262 RepID=A0A9N7Z0L9_PLEPL|nr:unnamed protein product [Pleuronectes platessa]